MNNDPTPGLSPKREAEDQLLSPERLAEIEAKARDIDGVLIAGLGEGLSAELRQVLPALLADRRRHREEVKAQLQGLLPQAKGSSFGPDGYLTSTINQGLIDALHRAAAALGILLD